MRAATPRTRHVVARCGERLDGTGRKARLRRAIHARARSRLDFGKRERFAERQRAAIGVREAIAGVNQQPERRGKHRLGPLRPGLKRPVRRTVGREQRRAAEPARRARRSRAGSSDQADAADPSDASGEAAKAGHCAAPMKPNSARLRAPESAPTRSLSVRTNPPAIGEPDFGGGGRDRTEPARQRAQAESSRSALSIITSAVDFGSRLSWTTLARRNETVRRLVPRAAAGLQLAH